MRGLRVCCTVDKQFNSLLTFTRCCYTLTQKYFMERATAAYSTFGPQPPESWGPHDIFITSPFLLPFSSRLPFPFLSSSFAFLPSHRETALPKSSLRSGERCKLSQRVRGAISWAPKSAWWQLFAAASLGLVWPGVTWCYTHRVTLSVTHVLLYQIICKNSLPT